MTAVRGAPAPTSGSRLQVVRGWLAHPLAPYYLLLGSVGLLLALGLIMVLSSSGVLALRESGDSYAIVKRQLMWVAAGIPLAFLVSRAPVRVIRGFAWPLLVGSIGLLLLTYVPGFGVEVRGSTNWVDFGGPFRFQPSEFAKLALVVWGAHVLAAKGPRLAEVRHLVVPLFLGVGAVVALTLGQRDLGNPIVLAAIVLGLLWVAGIPLWLMGVSVGGVGAVAAYFVLSEQYRRDRILSFLDPFEHRLDIGYQAVASIYAFSSGGWWGTGLGASRQKWGRLPDAHTDFIYAVIGEELGLVGSLVVLVLLLVLAYAGLRIATRATDPFVRFATAGMVTWIVVQSIVNIGAAIGVLPITGVPLPLVSYGGSAMVIGLVGLGIVVAGARSDPAVRAALAARRRRRAAAA